MKVQGRQPLSTTYLQVGVPTQIAGLLAMLPTTGEADELLPTSEEWCSIFWSALLTAPTNEFVKQSIAMNHHPTNPDCVVQPGNLVFWGHLLLHIMQ